MSMQASKTAYRSFELPAFNVLVENIKYVYFLVIVIFLAWLANGLVERIQKPTFLPINKIRIKGEMKYVTESMLQKSIVGQLSGGFFNTDVDRIQGLVEKLAWVDRASVRRVWPETLFIQVVEQQPMATWGNDGLINVRGEWFKPEVINEHKSLPVWQGPADTQTLLFEKNKDIEKMLLAIEMSVVELMMDKRQALQIKLNNGVLLMLGRREQLLRLQRFIDVYPKVLTGKMKKIKYVDLRYSNGLSVGWKKTNGMQRGEG